MGDGVPLAQETQCLCGFHTKHNNAWLYERLFAGAVCNYRQAEAFAQTNRRICSETPLCLHDSDWFVGYDSLAKVRKIVESQAFPVLEIKPDLGRWISPFRAQAAQLSRLDGE